MASLVPAAGQPLDDDWNRVQFPGSMPDLIRLTNH
jgi:hypothetical protein